MQTFPIAAALAGVLAMAAPARAADPAAGEKVFQKCRICHQIGETARNAVGPVLNGVVGRPAASLAGYPYSPAYKAAGAGGLVMDADNIGKWLAGPKAFVPGNKMAFAGLTSEQDIADVIAFVAQYGADGKKK